VDRRDVLALGVAMKKSDVLFWSLWWLLGVALYCVVF
jgi:hypothetical protein